MLFPSIIAGLPAIRVEYFIPIPVLSFLAFIPGLFRTHALGDQLCERLYTNHRDIWEALGRPNGNSWRPPGTWIALPNFATPMTFMSKTDPDWLAQAPELRELFYAYRAGLRRWNLVGMPTFVAASLFFGSIYYLFPPEGMNNLLGTPLGAKLCSARSLQNHGSLHSRHGHRHRSRKTRL